MVDVEPPPAIVARGLRKRFGATLALQGVDLCVPRGAAFGFIGENGAGKTTFIKLLLGICAPSAGDVQVLGAAPADVGVRRQVGYLPERLSLPPAFTPLVFLRSVGRLKGIGAQALESDIERVLTRVGLERSAWSRRSAGFSKGMKQRTGLAGALLGSPALLVLDEPTDGIDPMGRAQIRSVIEEEVGRGATVFLNSHLLSETERICSHVAILSRGRIVRTGALASLRDEKIHRVHFLPHPDLDAIARAAGFLPAPEREGPAGAFHFEGAGPEALSAALRTALERGLLVTEVTPRLRSLEDILAEAIQIPPSSPPAGRAP